MKAPDISGTRRRVRGASTVEFLIVAPILLLLGLGLVQFGMVFHAKSALNHALQEAARVGSVNNGDVSAIEEGLARGLVPFMGGGRNTQEMLQTQGRVIEEMQLGAASGWVRVRQLSPSPQSFTDWAEDAFDDNGNRVREIPNSSLAVLRCTRQPNSGVAGTRHSTACPTGGEPIGQDSQQTLSDANLLKLEMTYGVKLTVPLVNRIVGRALAMLDGCEAMEEQQISSLNLGTPGAVRARPNNCAFYNARNTDGDLEPRIPVNLAVTVRMQSPSRFAGNAGWFSRVARTRDANTGGVQLGNGDMLPSVGFAPIPVSQLNPNGLTAANDTYGRMSGDGSLAFGGNADWRAQYAASPGNGMGPGNGTGTGTGILPPPNCTEENAPPEESEGSSGILGQIWDALAGFAEDTYNFVRGFWDGIKQQIGDIVSMVTDPLETARGIYELAVAFIQDPGGTTRTIARALGTDLSTLLECGAFDRGRILGQYISPAFMLKIATKLARFGRGGLGRAAREARREMDVECASFGPGTPVMTADGLIPIDTILAGTKVRTRGDEWFDDSVLPMSSPVHRNSPDYFLLKTEHDQFALTPNHKLWVQGHGWMPVKDIEFGAAIATAAGDTLVVSKEYVNRPLSVYNFTVDKTHTYFVGKEQIWSHNEVCDITQWNAYGTVLPRHGSRGEWAGQRGNSDWRPYEGSPMHEATGGGVLRFRNGHPIFEDYAYRATPNGPRAVVDIEMRGNHTTDFTDADDAYRRLINDPNWERPEGVTWHHHENCRTMVLINIAIHNAAEGGAPHTGGASGVNNNRC
jgi:hypothetical protein